MWFKTLTKTEKEKEKVDITDMPYGTLLDYIRGELWTSFKSRIDAFDKKYNNKCRLTVIDTVETSCLVPYTMEFLRRNKMDSINGNDHYDLSDIHTIVDTFKMPYTIEISKCCSQIIIRFVRFNITMEYFQDILRNSSSRTLPADAEKNTSEVLLPAKAP
jgi:hypothetical protein